MEVFATFVICWAALELAAWIPVPTSRWLPRDDYAGGGKITGGTVGSRLPRRLSEQEATDREFLDELNGEPEAAEIVAREGLETTDAEAEVVEFNLADAYAKAEVSMEEQARRMERMRKEIEERKKKLK